MPDNTQGMSQDIRSVPDPTLLTTAQLYREVAALKELINQTISTQGDHFKEKFTDSERRIAESNKVADRHIDMAVKDMNSYFDEKLHGHKESFDTRHLQLYSQISSAKEVLETRLDAMDKAIELLQQQTTSQIQNEVEQLGNLHGERFTSMDTKFAGVQVQFAERDKRTEQLSLTDKTAIAAALQAQKEAAGATQEANSAALTKMEANFTKLIDQGQTLLQSVSKNTDEKIEDLKSRLDRGEGRTSVSDPAVADGMRQITTMLADLSTSRDASAGRSEGMAHIWGFIVGAAGLMFALFTLLRGPDPAMTRIEAELQSRGQLGVTMPPLINR